METAKSRGKHSTTGGNGGSFVMAKAGGSSQELLSEQISTDQKTILVTSYRYIINRIILSFFFVLSIIISTPTLLLSAFKLRNPTCLNYMKRYNLPCISIKTYNSTSKGNITKGHSNLKSKLEKYAIGSRPTQAYAQFLSTRKLFLQSLA